MGFFLLVAAGNDSTKATYCSGMRALMENPDQRQLLLDDPALVPSAVEESLRMFPAFAHFRRTATRDTELGGQPISEGDKVVMWYVSSNRDETRLRGPGPLRRHPQPRAPGVRRRRPALLPRRRAGAARAAGPVRGDAGALPGDGARRRARVRRVAVHQPAEDAAGSPAAVAAARLMGAERPSFGPLADRVRSPGCSRCRWPGRTRRRRRPRAPASERPGPAACGRARTRPRRPRRRGPR